MSLEAVTLGEELQKLDAAHSELKKSEQKLRTFILSPEFLNDYTAFENHLSDFQEKVITLVEVSTSPQPTLEQLQKMLGQPQQGEGQPQPVPIPEVKEFGMEKALVVVAAIAATGATVYYGYLPPISLLLVIAAALGLAFSPQLKAAVESLLHRKEEEKEELTPEKLEDWVNESISEIRNKYMSARFLIKVQNQTKETLPPQYGELGLDEALFNREQYFRETLPHEFLSQIGRIMVACDRSMWVRKQVIVAAMVQAKQAAAFERT